MPDFVPVTPEHLESAHCFRFWMGIPQPSDFHYHTYLHTEDADQQDHVHPPEHLTSEHTKAILSP